MSRTDPTQHQQIINERGNHETVYNSDHRRNKDDTQSKHTAGTRSAAAAYAELFKQIQEITRTAGEIPPRYQRKDAIKMKVTSDTKIKTVSEPRADLFDRKVNTILATAAEAELIFNSRRPLTVHIVYTQKGKQ